jgi:hypothetical protein
VRSESEEGEREKRERRERGSKMTMRRERSLFPSTVDWDVKTVGGAWRRSRWVGRRVERVERGTGRCRRKDEVNIELTFSTLLFVNEESRKGEAKLSAVLSLASA